MHRIDGVGAVNNMFAEGDPSVPQMATRVTSTWLNDVQENLVRCVEAAGITPVKGDYDQLRQAIGILSGSGMVGEGRLWFSEDLPESGDWMEADGASLLIVDYPALYAVYGHTWGDAPAGYFKIPDGRGVFWRGWDHGRGRDPDAALRTGGDHVGSTQADAIRKHNHPMGNAGGQSGPSALVDAQQWNTAGMPYNFYTRDYSVSSDGINPSAFANVPQGLETRPANTACMYIIRWR